MRTQADRIEVDHDHPGVTMPSISNGQSKQGLIRLVTAAIAAGLAVVGFGQAAAQEQLGDPDWRPKVLRPAYAAGEGPRIVLDAAHGSRQTIDGRYAGFAALMRADGYRIEPGQTELDTASALREVSILVISNAASPRDGSGRASAFSDAEIETVAAWVQGGGSLLLVADHAPHGTAAEALAGRFGVTMAKGYAFQQTDEGLTTNLDFEGPALGVHPIISGRDSDERVRRVHTFTGQSLQGPPGSTILLALDDRAREAVDHTALAQIVESIRAGEPTAAASSRPALPAQGLAFSFGEGRVVVLGEAGMLTAQILRSPEDPNSEPFRFGLNTEGHDDQQFALNVIHWLSRVLP